MEKDSKVSEINPRAQLREGEYFPSRDLVLEQIQACRPGLKLDYARAKRGSETTVIPAYEGGQKYALRIGGTGQRELRGYRMLAGLEGIPRLHEVFIEPAAEPSVHHDEVCALLVDFIDGMQLSDCVAISGLPELLKLERHLIKLVRDVHSRGCLMPDDWTKWGQIIVKDGQPFLVDIGAHRKAPDNKREAKAYRATDLWAIPGRLMDPKLSIESIIRHIAVQMRFLPNRF